MDFKLIISGAVAFFALINPIHKIFVISSLQNQFNDPELRYLSIKSSFTAFLILLFFMFLGELIFNYVFHIQLYAFKVACGVVLFYNGINGLQKGVFLRLDKNINLNDVLTVPIAMPMIAGPATITAAVTFPSHYGRLNTISAIIIAISLNLLFMLFAKQIGKLLTKLNVMNALIRITGLIVATIGLQLIFDGVANFINTLNL
ncbi:MAG: antibiotic resistance protein MarC [Bacteroidetes bacterium GWC2_33_15]|nr:MAG: antibiotic resistance protein MarC [Bacteroidetes bacterium GWA2_33_15]OFX49497.1 MAG: antibiotic resistance protein MarC [Bacteroidetes bacterium GWC2_33_15]OFX63664.1 MAG: antibiotic resistance protein MarC [Bacteroidetes bacterium GWB2_32_14]OFX68878.1 MAG: antibiotic resistance protein MarC [Bacteroidetes bacterium GWD2_33_33]HAN17520.1 MarC family protein [Bacteroidales bacterium]